MIYMVINGLELATSVWTRVQLNTDTDGYTQKFTDVYIHRLVYTHKFPGSVSGEGLETIMCQQQRAHLAPGIGF